MHFALLPEADKDRHQELDSWNIRPLFFPNGEFERIDEFLALLAGNSSTKKALPRSGESAPKALRHLSLDKVVGVVGPCLTNSVDRMLEKTMSNPRYISDLRSIEVGSIGALGLVSAEMIIIVTGSGLDAELFDRPVAEMIRDVIDQRGAPTRSGEALSSAT